MTRFRHSHGYGLEEIQTFFRAIDHHLNGAASVVIIGGAAAGFHGAISTTNDVDTYEVVGADLHLAIQRATSTLAIPMNHSPVADVPWNFEDRLERQLPELAKLEVWILEKHDLALSKTVRGSEHDEQQIREIHDRVGLDFDVLVPRFRDEMSHVTGDPERIRQQFLQLIQTLFGELKRVAAAKLLVHQRP